MAKVELTKIVKHYGTVVAVEDFNLAIDEGELVVFVGPSGCGKSTTLRMIAGLEAITSGQLTIAGRDVTRLEPKDRNVAMVFQNYALYPHKTVYDNLGFGLRMRGISRAEIDQRVKQTAEMLRISELLARKPKALSGGQMQRVALGRALVRDPDIFLLDEPLSNLDAKLRVRMREEIARLHRKVDTSMVYVTHDQVEAMTLGDRIVVMNLGRIQQVGPPLELYDRPANTFVAGFIGSPEMNLLPATVTSDGAQPMVSLAGQPLALSPGVRPPAGSVTLGLRPEHLSLAAGANGDAAGITAPILRVEQMGAQTLIACDLGQHELIALLVRNDQVREGERVRLTIPPEALHLFDAESGVRLT